MKLLITKVDQAFAKNGSEYRKVTGTNIDTQQETTKSVFDNLQDKWSILQEGRIVNFTLEKKGQFWNTTDVSLVEAPPAQQPQPAHNEAQVMAEAKQAGERNTRTPHPVVEHDKDYRIAEAVAFKGAVDLIASGKVPPDKEMHIAVYNFIMKYLDPYLDQG